MKKAAQIIALVIVFAVLIFLGNELFFKKEDKKNQTEVIKAEENNSSKKKEATLPVRVTEVKRGSLPLRLTISATADVWEKTTIRSEVSGKVEKINCSIGDWVKQGQLLVKIEDREKKLDVESRRAAKLSTLSKYLVKETTVNYDNPEISAKEKQQLKTLRDKYRKALKDFEQGKISDDKLQAISDEYERMQVMAGTLREEILKATENLTQSTVALQQAELDLKRTSIRSPFQGKIADLMISVGERISVNHELLKVVNLKSAYLRGFALESELSKLKVGTRVRIRFDAYPGRYFYGHIDAISPEVDLEKKTIPVYIKVDNSEMLVLPGMHAEIDIEYKVFENVIKVPVKAVITRQERYLVFVVRDNIALWAYVEVGEKNDEEWEIKKFVDPKYGPGDQIVVEGHLTLAHQSRVRIVK